MGWLADYIGIEFREHGRTHRGADCWGLIRLIYMDQFNIDLPDYGPDYCSTMDGEAIQGIMESESDNWLSISGNDIQFGDIVVMRIRGYQSHVGMVISQHEMIHIETGIDSVIEAFDSMRWSRRLRGFYRHKDMKGITWEQSIAAGA